MAEKVYRYVCEEVARGSEEFAKLTRLDDCVCIKNDQGVLVYSNEAHRQNFSPDASPVGRTSHAYLEPEMARRSESIEKLVYDGCSYIECEHSGTGPDGSYYRMVVHKRSLRSLQAPGFALLAVVRLVEKQQRPPNSDKVDIAACCGKFRELSERDREICRQTALGASSRELGERLGMTTRGIELRKQKAFAHLGVAKAVDLARLLVRLQDRGYLDLGL